MYVPVTGDFAIDPRNVPLAVQAMLEVTVAWRAIVQAE